MQVLTSQPQAPSRLTMKDNEMARQGAGITCQIHQQHEHVPAQRESGEWADHGQSKHRVEPAYGGTFACKWVTTRGKLLASSTYILDILDYLGLQSILAGMR